MEARHSPSVIRIFAALASIATGISAPGEAQEVAPVSAPQHSDENGEAMQRTERAFALTFTYNSDANANISGGKRTGAAYLQRLGLIGDADLARILGWTGATAHISAHSIVGAGLSTKVGNLLSVSGIEAKPALRLFNLWIEQKFADNASLRIGQFSAGQEFVLSPTANLFVNSTFGWPGSFAADLPDGGPAYPVAVPGARATVSIDNGKTIIRTAIFAGNPTRGDLRGVEGWRFSRPPFAIAEVARTSGGGDPAWTVIAGGWASFDRFADLRVSSGRKLAGDHAIYLVADARLWARGSRTLHGFARVTFSPGDRNLVRRYFDAGITVTAPIATRPHDMIGVAIASAGISPLQQSGNDRVGTNAPAPAETVIEASYLLQLGKALYVQPNAQLVLNPYEAAPASPPIRRVIVMGVRTSLRL